MRRPHPTLFALQQLTSDLAHVNRNHHLLGSDRSENDIEHSFTVALLCWYLHEKLQLNLDITKILKYAFVHDFAEVYAGDVNTYASPEARAQKIKDEAAAVARLSKEFADFPDMVQSLNSYEARQDEESLFVWTVDKMQSLILADLDAWRPYKKIDIPYQAFAKKHHEQLASCSKHCHQIFDTLLEYCKTTYYDRPTNK